MEDDREDIMEFSGKLPYKFDGLFKQLSMHLTKAQRQHDWKTFESNISEFGADLEVKDQHLKEMIKRTKSGKVLFYCHRAKLFLE